LETKSLTDLHKDPENARTHNPRNLDTLVDGLKEVGAARSGVIDEDGRILAGNATFEALGRAGIDKVIVVPASGDEWVVVQRAGLTEREKRRLALLDNRAAELAEWDEERLAEFSADGLLDGMWWAEEKAAIMAAIEDASSDGQIPEMVDAPEEDVGLRVTVPAGQADEVMVFLDKLYSKGVRWIRT